MELGHSCVDIGAVPQVLQNPKVICSNLHYFLNVSASVNVTGKLSVLLTPFWHNTAWIDTSYSHRELQGVLHS
jgi:hypothetical protein